MVQTLRDKRGEAPTESSIKTNLGIVVNSAVDWDSGRIKRKKPENNVKLYFTYCLL